MPNIEFLFFGTSPDIHTHTDTHTFSHVHKNAQLTIEPFTSFDAGATVAHQFLLVLLHQALKAVSVLLLEMLLIRFNLLKRHKTTCHVVLQDNKTSSLLFYKQQKKNSLGVLLTDRMSNVTAVY